MDDDAKREHRNLSPVPRRAVNEVLERLRSGPDPHRDLALDGRPNFWRARARRRWRVIYELMPDRRIEVRRIRRREVAYEGLERPPRELAEPLPVVTPSAPAPAIH